MQVIVSYLYLGTGIVFLLAYLPQIHAVWRDTTGARSTSLLSWGMYAGCSAITLLYATLQVQDLRFMAITVIGLAGNVAVLSIAGCRRIQYAQRVMLHVRAFPMTDIFMPYAVPEPVDLPVMAPESLPDRGYHLYH